MKKHQQTVSDLPEESVWDYPRPARCEPFDGVIVIEHEGELIARSQAAYRVIETSHPPTYYMPRSDVMLSVLHPNERTTLCEWKGRASYYDMVIGGALVKDVAWAYFDPTPGFAPMEGYLAFYPSKLDACYINGEKIQPQEGDFYGGWVTSNLKGPFKGGAGTMGW